MPPVLLKKVCEFFMLYIQLCKNFSTFFFVWIWRNSVYFIAKTLVSFVEKKVHENTVFVYWMEKCECMPALLAFKTLVYKDLVILIVLKTSYRNMFLRYLSSLFEICTQVKYLILFKNYQFLLNKNQRNVFVVKTCITYLEDKLIQFWDKSLLIASTTLSK